MAIFSVWGYCIANADYDDHSVLLNPEKIANTLGGSVEDVNKAVKFLCSPDPHSKNSDAGGRRLQHMSGWSYLVVSHDHYRNIKNKADAREYERKRKQKQREKKNVPECPGQSGTPVSVSVSVSESVLDKGEREGGSEIMAKWNDIADKHNLTKLKTFSPARIKKYESRIRVFGRAEFWETLNIEIPLLDDFVHEGKWFGFGWLIHSDNNFTKLSEGNYQRKANNGKHAYGSKEALADRGEYPENISIPILNKK